jgi:hypothetical protein
LLQNQFISFCNDQTRVQNGTDNVDLRLEYCPDFALNLTMVKTSDDYAVVSWNYLEGN